MGNLTFLLKKGKINADEWVRVDLKLEKDPTVEKAALKLQKNEKERIQRSIV